MSLSLDGTAGISCSGNIVSSAGIISVTGNIYGGNLIGTLAPSQINVAGNLSAYGLTIGLTASSTGGIISACLLYTSDAADE